MLKVTCWCRFSCMTVLWCCPAWDVWETSSVLIFTFRMKRAQTQANTMIQKSKLVHLQTKFIHWTTYVYWGGFFYCHFCANGLRALATERIFFFGKRPKFTMKSEPSRQVLNYGQRLEVYPMYGCILHFSAARSFGCKTREAQIMIP